MSDGPVYLRVCVDCGEEYQPHMTRCVECGGVLKDKLEGEVPEPRPETPGDAASSLPPGDYQVVASGLGAATVARMMGRFLAASIPVKVGSVGYDLSVSARVEDMPAVRALLERHGVLPKQPDAAEPAVAAEGGPCPACGTRVSAGSQQCPDCGLQLADSEVCGSCGTELAPSDVVCPSCSQPQES
jgi:hypothetical protein